MAGPSNIRVNPFTGTGGATNYVELTEKHIIPAVSPYVIRLNEVPEKQDPSNMKMVYVNESTGAATSTTLTEVAATPGKGEFRPDYSTNALEDKTWNTGLIEFSASDAGKIVQITYTGTGTLAGVTSNHWPSWYTDRGDGSDGDFVPTENTTISGVKNYKSVFIKEGVTVTVDKYARIKCQGAFINEGIINSTTYPQGKLDTSGQQYYITISTGGVASYGKEGAFSFISNADKNSLIYFSEQIYAGGQGGSNGKKKGGGGGGCIIITSANFKNNIIKANGQDGESNASSGGTSAGAGGGGVILVVTGTSLSNGSMTVTGGAGGAGYDGIGAAGSDGIAIIKELGV